MKREKRKNLRQRTNSIEKEIRRGVEQKNREKITRVKTQSGKKKSLKEGEKGTLVIDDLCTRKFFLLRRSDTAIRTGQIPPGSVKKRAEQGEKEEKEETLSRGGEKKVPRHCQLLRG